MLKRGDIHLTYACYVIFFQKYIFLNLINRFFLFWNTSPRQILETKKYN